MKIRKSAKTSWKTALAVLFITCTSTGLLLAGQLDTPILDEEIEEEVGPNWWTGEDVSIGGILFPHFHLRAAAGGSTKDPADFQLGAHDPFRDGFTLQGVELGLSLRLNDYIEGFVSYHAFLDESDNLEGEWEEIFGKIKNIPGGLELRGGQYLVRFGYHNAQHMHAWNWVDQYLVSARFLGEEGLYMRGGEITWNVPTPFTSALTFAAGVGRSHDHSHGEEGHDHGEEAEYEGEDAFFSDDNAFYAARYMVKYDYNDFHQFTGGISAAFGENLFGRNTQIYGLDFEYLWRQNGYEPGGDYLRWRSEFMVRRVEAGGDGHGHHDHGHDDHGHDDHGHDDHGHDDHGHHDDHDDDHHDDHGEEEHGGGSEDFTEFGFYSELAYGFLDHFEAAVRLEYVEGIEALGQDRRWRTGPGLTWYPTVERNLFVRVQYNYDNSDDMGDAHTVWAQFGFDWGSPEVR